MRNTEGTITDIQIGDSIASNPSILPLVSTSVSSLLLWNNPSNPDQITNEHFLEGAGVGLLYSPVENLNLRLDLTLPLVNIRDRSVNAQDDGIYFSLGYTF